MKKLIFLFSILFIFSCSSDDEISMDEETNTDVYIFGVKNNQPCYWKNNDLVMINAPLGTELWEKREMIVENNNIHVFYSNETNSYYVKNNITYNLNNLLSTAEDQLIEVTDMKIVGNDVYFVGFTKNVANPEIVHLAYWKNNVKTELSAVSLRGFPHINVINNLVYTSFNYSNTENGYFVNNTYISTPGFSHQSFDLKNGELYSLARRNYDSKSVIKNITTNQVEEYNFYIYGMKVFNNDLYYKDSIGKVFKNNSLIFTSPSIGLTNDIFSWEVDSQNNLYTIVGTEVNNHTQSILKNNDVIKESGPDEMFFQVCLVEN